MEWRKTENNKESFAWSKNDAVIYAALVDGKWCMSMHDGQHYRILNHFKDTKTEIIKDVEHLKKIVDNIIDKGIDFSEYDFSVKKC